MYGWSKSRFFCVLMLGLSPWMFACGPSFPNSYLTASDDLLLKAPGFSFAEEIRRIEIESEDEFKAFNSRWPSNIRKDTIKIEIDDLRQSLKSSRYSPDQIEQTVANYQNLRENLNRYYNEPVVVSQANNKDKPVPTIQFSNDLFDQPVPDEFRLYLKGAVYSQNDRHDKATEVWLKIFDLPADHRRYKSTWAAYMIAKYWTWYHKDKEKSCHWYQRVRDYARTGFVDSLGLAATSYGDEAGQYYVEGQYEKALDLYLLQTLTGDTTAIPSLKCVCHTVFEKCDQQEIIALIQNPKIRQVLVAYAITFVKTEKYNAFVREKGGDLKRLSSQQLLLDAIEQAGTQGVENADRLAMIAYKAGDFDRAARWLSAADPDSLITRRVQAKMNLRTGNIEAAAGDLAFIARRTNPYAVLVYHGGYSRVDSSYKIHSELGTLYISQKMYIQALDTLMRGGNWIDAAYIAERVLDADELKAYVDAHWPASLLEPINDEDGFGPQGQKALTIRHLLARRLTRLGKFESARLYYPASLIEDFNVFVTGMETGYDPACSDSDRAEAFWKTAKLLRWKGMELVGFELEPDWAIYGGLYKQGGRFAIRQDIVIDNTINVPDSDEIQRARRVVALPDKRRHYRYTAAEYVWQSVQFMPDDDEETARRLCVAGNWHKAKDPEYADKFYKSLVLRCGQTDLGKRAKELKWFPAVNEDI